MSSVPHRTSSLLPLLAVVPLACTVALGACATPSGEPLAAGAATPTGRPSTAPATISPERCAANEAAGRLTYLTGYQFQSSAGILEAVAADELGLFRALCLDVEIRPGTGDTAGNAQLVAAGAAQITSLGSESEAMLAVANGVAVVGVLTWGHVPIATLMTGPEVTELTQLEGTVLGHKGSLPAPLRAMLVAAGVDVDTLQLVQVGYDPSVLPRGQVTSLTGYKSNEPLLLDAMGETVVTWDPEDAGVVGSFGTLVVDPQFAAEHPTAVEDYLRAVLRAFDHCATHGSECVGYAAQRSEAGYDEAHNLRIWQVERDLVLAHTPAGLPLGFLDPELTAAEGQNLVDSGELQTLPDVSTVLDPSFLSAVHDGAELIWPAP